MAHSGRLPARRLAARLSSGSRSVAGSDEALPALPGPHGERQSRSGDGHQGMPVAVPSPALELFDVRWRQLRLRSDRRSRSVVGSVDQRQSHRLDVALGQKSM